MMYPGIYLELDGGYFVPLVYTTYVSPPQWYTVVFAQEVAEDKLVKRLVGTFACFRRRISGAGVRLKGRILRTRVRMLIESLTRKLNDCSLRYRRMGIVTHFTSEAALPVIGRHSLPVGSDFHARIVCLFLCL